MDSFEGVYWVSEPPAVELVDGNFMLTFTISDSARIKVIMSPANFFRTRRRNGLAVVAFNNGERNIVAFANDESEVATGH